MKTFREFMYEEDNFGQAKKVMRKHSDRLKKLHRQIDKGSGSGEDVNEDKREEKARRSELAKKHGIDMTKPGARAKLTRLMKADTISKKRKESGDVRSDKEVRKDNAINRKEIDTENLLPQKGTNLLSYGGYRVNHKRVFSFFRNYKAHKGSIVHR